MDKLTAIKIKYDDGTYSDEIPVSVLSKNVEWDSTHTLVDVLGSIDVTVTGTIQDQISQLFNEKVSSSQLSNYVTNQLNTDVTNWLNNNVDPVGSAVIVDSSLTIQGAAADAKVVGNLKSAITRVTSEIGYTITPTEASLYAENHYITNTGVNQKQSNFSVYGLIELLPGMTIHVTARGYSTLVAIIATTTEEASSFVPVVISTDDVIKEYEYTASDRIYVVISSNKNTPPVYYITQESINERINDIINEARYPEIEENANWYIHFNGSIVPVNNFAYSDPIQVNKGEIVDFYAKGWDNNVSMISICSQDGSNITPKVISPDHETKKYQYIVEDDGYIIVSYDVQDVHNLTIYKADSKKAIVERIDNIEQGAAADAKKTGDKISKLEANLNDTTVTWVVGKYVHKETGTEQANSAYSHTDYILCISGLRIKTKMGNDLAGICFYDSQYNFISGFNSYSNNESLFDLVIPDNAVYVRISCLSSYKDSFVLERYDSIPIIQQNIGDLKTDVTILKRDNNLIQTTIEKSKNLCPVESKTSSVRGTTVNYSDGEISVSGTGTESGGRITPITKNITLSAGTYTFGAFNLVCPIFLEKTTDNSVVSSILTENASKSTFTLSEETTVYIGINVNSGASYDFTCQIQIESGESKTKFQKPSYTNAIDLVARKSIDLVARKSLELSDEFWSQSMWKVLCIGDSLTSGANYAEEWGELASSGASIDQNYPRILGRLINGEVTNAGFSGYSASSWYTNKINNYTFTNYDTFIIWLGTNNGLTDTLDTDVDPYDDYNDFATTETGYYCKIIEAIKEANKDCLIVLTKVFASTGNVTTTNTVIDKIAEKYNLPVIDNSDLTVANYPKLHANINNPHFGKAGYIFIANRYVKEMSKWFAEDVMRCEYGYTARTN